MEAAMNHKKAGNPQNEKIISLLVEQTYVSCTEGDIDRKDLGPTKYPTVKMHSPSEGYKAV